MAGAIVAASVATTVGAILARALAGHAHRAVELRTIATVGARTEAVLAQLDTLPAGFTPDITVVIVGGNDLTGHVPLAESIMALQEVVQALQSLGSAVVLGTLPSLPQPLREFGGQMSRRLAAAQFTAAAAAGAHPVLLGRAVRQIFLSDPGDMFAVDGFHPSNLGYRAASLALVPALLDAFDAGHPGAGGPATGVPRLRPGAD
ncbi:MAG: GDSL-type esterase/lipase family protein [Specibacter sp.]